MKRKVRGHRVQKGWKAEENEILGRKERKRRKGQRKKERAHE